MDIVKSLTNWITSKEKIADTPVGICPNCWGKQEYGNQFYEAMRNQNVNANENSDKRGWVAEYAEKHLSPIALIEEDGMQYCQKCKLTYRPA